MLWILTLISLVGVILNIKRKKACFVLWAVTNFWWMVVDLRAGLIEQAVLFFIYFLLALWGLWEWRGRKSHG